MTTYLATEHGSRLYGLATPDSDYDTFTVHDEKRGRRLRDAKQRLVGRADDVNVGLTTFLVNCDKGVPQYLEAMFSPVAMVHPNFVQYRAGYRVNHYNTWKTYHRTVKDFREQDTPKMRRHALRLLINLNEALRSGRFNPRLTPAQATYLTYVCEHNNDLYDFTFEKMLRGWAK